MKTNIFIALILTLTFYGCDPHNRFFDSDEPPTVPSGLSFLALDRQVELWWDENPEYNVAGYNIYSASSANGRYRLIGTSRDPQYIDRYLTNGSTYYYAVSAYDDDGNESELTDAYVYATPRPEGFDLALFDYRHYPNTAGYDFSLNTFGRYDDEYTDIFFENDNGIYYMDVWNDTDIQDMGYTIGLDDITIAPVDGWSPTKDVQLIRGHTYVVWTWDDHYAKFRVFDITSDHVILDWAYQLVIGNPDLKHQKTATGDRFPLSAGKPLQQ